MYRSARLEGAKFVLLSFLEGFAPEEGIVGSGPAQVVLAIDPFDGIALYETLDLFALHIWVSISRLHASTENPHIFTFR
jgi:hypothetical protein